MWIYKTIVIPILNYRAVVWAMKLTTSQIAKMNTIKTLAQQMITRCKTITPKVLLNVLLNTMPLDINLNR